MERGGFDVMILTEKKIYKTAYCRNRLGYEVTYLVARPPGLEEIRVALDL